MKTIITLAACAAIMMSGCSTNVENNNLTTSLSGISDKKTKKELTVEYFTELYITGAPDIIFKQTSGGKPKVCIEGSKSYVDRVYAQNRGKSLVIGLKDSHGLGNIWNNGEAKIYLYAPDLTGIIITGSGDFKAMHGIDTDKLKINVTGSGDVDLANLVCDDVDIRITGSGDLDVKSAACNNADIRVTGSGDVEFDRLTARQSAKIVTTGSGDVDIKFENSGDILCRATGCSDIKLKGTVRSMDKKCSGNGDVYTRGLRIVK